MNGIGPAITETFLIGLARKLKPCPVVVEAAARSIRARDADRRCLCQSAKPLLAFAKDLFGAKAFQLDTGPRGKDGEGRLLLGTRRERLIMHGRHDAQELLL